ncbi:MAG: hypothetical protein IJJ10_03280 [Bacillus sp. (in: Bacteria)]|nr:hypothetical protein [Bacillus sp. (in: firmicutes)]
MADITTLITWDGTGEREFEAGVDRGVFYPIGTTGTYTGGVAWNGLTNVSENPDGAEPNDIYADNIKYVTMRSVETYGLSVEAYTYPDEFANCDGTSEIAAGVRIGQQNRKAFGFCWRTMIGDDQHTDLSKGYKLHIAYGCTASPSDKAYDTINDSPDAVTFSWDFTTTPVAVSGENLKPTASIEIDSTKVTENKLRTFEQILYGTPAGESSEAIPARLPLPDEIALHFAAG